MVSEKELKKALEEVVDPEAGFNIVEMGFVHKTEVEESKAIVKLCLACPQCHMSMHIVSEAESKLKEIDGIEEAEVEIILDPPWKPERASKKVRKALGL